MRKRSQGGAIGVSSAEEVCPALWLYLLSAGRTISLTPSHTALTFLPTHIEVALLRGHEKVGIPCLLLYRCHPMALS
jgi:hypothetical protein